MHHAALSRTASDTRRDDDRFRHRHGRARQRRDLTVCPTSVFRRWMRALSAGCLIGLLSIATPVTALATGARSGPLASVAARVRHCGRLYASVRDITSRGVVCRSAVRFVARWEHCHNDQCVHFEGWHCTFRYSGQSMWSKCVRGSRYIRWYTGP